MALFKVASAAILLSSSPSLFSAAYESDSSDDAGLSEDGEKVLEEAGLFVYLDRDYNYIRDDSYSDGQGFDGLGFIKYFYPDGYSNDGPSCIAGTDFSFYVRQKGGTGANPDPHAKKLLIFLQGGGACWENFFSCNEFSENQSPFAFEQCPTDVLKGVWEFENPANPFGDSGEYDSVIYAPYCDGSVWIGDNEVQDVNFEAYLSDEYPGFQPFVGGRNHRGLRNLSAVIEAAHDLFPDVTQLTILGHSAGGVGAFTSVGGLCRKVFGSDVKLTLFNDAGPIIVNPEETIDIQARANDWNLAKYASICAECDPSDVSGTSILDQAGAAVIDWFLQNDKTVRMATYSSVLDSTNTLGYLKIKILDDSFQNLQCAEIQYYANLLLGNNDVLTTLHPDRYKVYIPFGDALLTHGSVILDLWYQPGFEGAWPSVSQWTQNFIDDSNEWTNRIFTDFGELDFFLLISGCI